MTLDVREISKILPHRYPFLFVDKVVEIDIEKGTIIAQKNVTRNEEFFQGHFPGIPIMPGVLILEALAQAGGILIHQKGFKEPTALLLSVNNVKFRRAVVPGDILMLNVEEIYFGARGGKVKARATVEGSLVAEAEIGFALRAEGQL